MLCVKTHNLTVVRLVQPYISKVFATVAVVRIAMGQYQHHRQIGYTSDDRP
ncbi:hypothetical protein D3C73_1466310 [compost metagenome]